MLTANARSSVTSRVGQTRSPVAGSVRSLAAAVSLVLAGAAGAGCTDSDTTTSVVPASHAVTTTGSTAEHVTTTLANLDFATAWFITGTVSDFQLDEGVVTSDAAGTAHSRGGTFSDTFVSSDPRASGKVTGTWNSDRWGPSPANGILVQWGEATLTNDGGSWSGQWAGTMASPVGDMVSRWWVGSGGYEGLTFFMWMQAKDVGDPTTTWMGVIYRGAPPLATSGG